MISMTRRGVLTAASLLPFTPFPLIRAARAQSYPSRPVHLLVGAPAGSVPDAVARVIGDRLASALGQTVVVENRPGAAGNLAMQALASSAPDGHTLALATMSQAVFNTYLFTNPGYDPLRDLTPVSPLVSGAFALAAHPSLPANTFSEFVTLAQKQPSQLLVGTAQLGSPPYVTLSLLQRATGIRVTVVPFRSGQDGLTAVTRGDTQAFVDAPTIIVPQAKAGSLKVLVVTGREREPELPNVPTVAEVGFPEAQSEAWIGLVAPAHVPAEIVSRLNREITTFLTEPELRRRLGLMSFTTVSAGPEQFQQMIGEEHGRWSKVIREAGLRLE
jgi:tripartite-type tricarboxylate transporter receptor subunit TctC